VVALNEGGIGPTHRLLGSKEIGAWDAPYASMPLSRWIRSA